MKQIASLTPSDIISVYSGKAGKCCCGCSGIHRYNSAYVTEASKRRGYPVRKSEINDVHLKKVLKIIQTLADYPHPKYVSVRKNPQTGRSQYYKVSRQPTYVSVDVGCEKLYIAYFLTIPKKR